MVEEKDKPVSQGTDKEKAKPPEGAEPPKKSPGETDKEVDKIPPEEPKVRRSAQDRIKELVKERDEARTEAQRLAKLPPPKEEDLEGGEEEEEEPVDKKTVKKMLVSSTKRATEVAKKAVEEAIAPLIDKLTGAVDQQELSEALAKFPDQAKDKVFIQRVVKYGETHKTVPFEDIILTLLAKDGKTGEPEPSEEDAGKTRIGGKPSQAGRQVSSVAGKTTEELEKEIKGKTKEEIDEAIKGM